MEVGLLIRANNKHCSIHTSKGKVYRVGANPKFSNLRCLVLYDQGDICKYKPLTYTKDEWIKIFDEYESYGTLSPILVFAIIRNQKDFDDNEFANAIKIKGSKSGQDFLNDLLNDIWRIALYSSKERQQEIANVLNKFNPKLTTTQEKTIISEAISYCQEISRPVISPEINKKVDPNRINIFNKIHWVNSVIKVLSSDYLPITNNPLINVIRWKNGCEGELPFETLVSFFYCFHPIECLDILKKIAHEIKADKIKLTLDDLIRLVESNAQIKRIQSKYYCQYKEYLFLDLLVYSLDAYSRTGKFLTKGKVIDIFNSIKDRASQIDLRLHSLFDHCDGGLLRDYKFKGLLCVEEESEGYRIALNKDVVGSFPNSEQIESSILDDIKGTSAIFSDNHWRFSNTEKDAVFALTTRYFSRLESGYNKQNKDSYNYTFDKAHFLESNHSDQYLKMHECKKELCNGRISSQKDVIMNRYFLWCNGNVCFRNTLKTPDDYKNYKLSDFCDAFGLKVYEDNPSDCGLIPNEELSRFIDTLSRIKRILPHMYCKSCNHFLFPERRSSKEYVNTYNRFSCHNSGCTEKGVVIYLNHCHTPNCKGVIDSRIQKKCPNGMHICPGCSGCCSNDFYIWQKERKLSSGTPVSTQLENQINNQLGHNDKGEFYCYKCGEKLMGAQCAKCNIEHKITRRYKYDF